MKKAKQYRRANFSWDQACWEEYQRLRTMIEEAPDVPAGWSPVVELAKMSEMLPKGAPLRFLCLREVASYTNPKMINPANKQEVPSPSRRNIGKGPPRGVDLSSYVRPVSADNN